MQPHPHPPTNKRIGEKKTRQNSGPTSKHAGKISPRRSYKNISARDNTGLSSSQSSIQFLCQVKDSFEQAQGHNSPVRLAHRRSMSWQPERAVKLLSKKPHKVNDQNWRHQRAKTINFGKSNKEVAAFKSPRQLRARYTCQSTQQHPVWIWFGFAFNGAGDWDLNPLSEEGAQFELGLDQIQTTYLLRLRGKCIQLTPPLGPDWAFF